MDKYLRSFSTSNVYFAAVLLFLMYLLWLMMKPFVGAIIFAAIITGSVYPLFNWLLEKTRFARNVVAILICCLVIVVIFFPIIYLSFLLSKEAITFYHSLAIGLNDDLVNDFLFGGGYIARAIREVSTLIGVEINMQGFKVEVVDQLKQLSGLIIDTINDLVGNIVSFLFSFVIMILVIYALLSEGPQLKEFLLKLSPLPDDQEELIINSFNQMNFVTLVCNSVGGLIQGVLAGIGFWLAGIELVVLWASIMVILAFIPLIGISFIYIPACIYLYIIGKTSASIALFIYCSLVALIVENWFKPIFIGKRIKINALLVLFTIIGGMTVFGFGGIFYGPVIATLFLTMVDLYHKFYITN